LHELFYLRTDTPAQRDVQIHFNHLLLDQRCEEGRTIARWIERMHALPRPAWEHAQGQAGAIGAASSASGAVSSAVSAAYPSSIPPTLTSAADVDPRATVSPELIATFIELMRAELFRRYDLAAVEAERETQRQQQRQQRTETHTGSIQQQDDADAAAQQTELDAAQYTLSDPLVLFLQRMLYPRLSVLVLSLRADREIDLDHWYAKKLSWIRLLSRAQLGLNRFFLPPGTDMDATQTPLWNESAEAERAAALEAAMMVPGMPGAAAAMPFGPAVAQGGASHSMSEPVDEDEHDDSAGSQGVDPGDPDAPLPSSAALLSVPPFHSAMQLLHRANVGASMAPVDLLYILIRTVREVTRLANAYLHMHREAERQMREQQQHQQQGTEAEEPSSAASAAAPQPPSTAAAASSSSSSSAAPLSSLYLHADHMFPLLLYVVIHSGLRAPHFLFGHLARFLPDSLRHFGTAGYSLSVIEGAVAHICDMDKKDVQQAGASAAAASVGAAALAAPSVSRKKGAKSDQGNDASSSSGNAALLSPPRRPLSGFSPSSSSSSSSSPASSGGTPKLSVARVIPPLLPPPP
jgi:hypothetical protein